ncbi:SSI family serine proteinase inhibitor [Tenggerimyces flavus]|uniref:SSI family serine proteinase inhibitor n=1 Tax=Tenggerimyces flavus TaxID=1708749 RepID=A0ABV7Y9G4_9ACTN|nr:SSI family serine proteinase inhibitor [Tenggerimyces flavus]MBM7785733.1 hypothetical protein [Tenggerimyces flavus]
MTALTITVWAEPNEQPRVWELTDDPAGGTHPNAQAAIAALENAKGDPFAPVPPGTISTMIYGGPDRAQIVGEWKGRRVSAEYSRTNGAEIARWNALAAVFGANG